MVDEGEKLVKSDGYNVGGTARQTVMHFHIHLIPRRSGDNVNPRGGARRDRGQGRLFGRRITARTGSMEIESTKRFGRFDSYFKKDR